MAKCVKRFERYNVLDTALYKNYPLPLFTYFTLSSLKLLPQAAETTALFFIEQFDTIYLIIRRCARTGAFPGAFCVPNSVALASLTLQVVN